MTSRPLVVLLSTLMLGSCSVSGVSAAEEPPYELLVSDGRIEVRQYDELLVAQTVAPGESGNLSSVAFRRLAGFIFGDNESRQKVAMTSPVLEQPAPTTQPSGEKIAMTAPVLEESSGSDWVMTFIMPSGYTVETLPRPNDPRVEIRTLPARKVATIRFSGLMGKGKVGRHSAELLSWIEKNEYVATSAPRTAGYDPPWTLPPLRRNEIHIDIE